MRSRTKTKISPQRRGLLAKVHIAKKELGVFDDDYRDILRREFGVTSSAALADRELESLVAYFESKGWRPQRSEVRGQRTEDRKAAQVAALKERIGQEVLHSDLTSDRLRGLVRKICGVDDLQWCGDAVRLKKLLAVIGNMLDRGDI